MIHHHYQYPGDPPGVAHEMTRAEFVKAYPDRSIDVYNGLGKDASLVERIPVRDVLCDLCNADVTGDETSVFLVRGSLYCQKCADESILPYVLSRSKNKER